MNVDVVPLVFGKKEKPSPPNRPVDENKKKIRTRTVTEVVREHTDSD